MLTASPLLPLFGQFRKIEEKKFVQLFSSFFSYFLLICLENHFKSRLVTPPPCYPLGPATPLGQNWTKCPLSRVHLSMNIADFLASCLIWPIFLENHFKSGLVTPLGVCQPHPLLPPWPKIELKSPGFFFQWILLISLASCLILPISLENHFKSGLSTPLGGVSATPPPPCYSLGPNWTKCPGFIFSMNSADLFHFTYIFREQFQIQVSPHPLLCSRRKLN